MAKILFIITLLVAILVLVQAKILTEQELKFYTEEAMILELNKTADIFEKEHFHYEKNSFQLIRCHYVDLGKDDPNKTGYNCDAETKHGYWHNQPVDATFNIDVRVYNDTLEHGTWNINDMIIRSKEGDQIYQIPMPRYGIVGSEKLRSIF